MLLRSSTTNSVRTLDDSPIEEELLRATNSVAVLPEAETYLLPVARSGSKAGKPRLLEMPSSNRVGQSRSLEVYTAYAYDDEAYFKEIKKLLTILVRQGWPLSCHDGEILYDTSWQNSSNHLKTANLILLLVSTTFLNSDFCYSEQMVLAVERHENEALCCVLPIKLYPLHPILLEGTPFGTLDFLPKNGQPISSDPHNAYTDITDCLTKKIQKMAYYL